MDRAGVRQPVIGLTGGIGSGKSTVARMLERLGCGVLDADRYAREALSDPQVVATLRHWWGQAVVNNAGQVDRAAIGRLVFDEPVQRQRLEGLIHPIVHARRKARRAELAADPAIVAIVEDAPLLIEAGIDRECDVLLFVDAPRAQRLARVAAGRGWDETELNRREANQLPLDNKRRRADYVVVNDAGEAELMARVRHVLSEILRTTHGDSGTGPPSGCTSA